MSQLKLSISLVCLSLFACNSEMLARHGSRSLTSQKYDLSLQLWQLARSEDELTEQGKTIS